MPNMPKITITKAFQRSSRGFFRYYSPLFNPALPRHLPGAPVFDLDPRPSTYPHMTVKTEKELIQFIYKEWGTGIYRIIGHIRGRRGSWTFWRGEVTDDGYVFSRRETREKKDIEKLKLDLAQAGSDEERQMIQDEIDLNKEIEKLDKDTVKLGFIPYLKPSGRRGQMVYWDDPDMGYKEQAQAELGMSEAEEDPEWLKAQMQSNEDEDWVEKEMGITKKPRKSAKQKEVQEEEYGEWGSYDDLR